MYKPCRPTTLKTETVGIWPTKPLEKNVYELVFVDMRLPIGIAVQEGPWTGMQEFEESDERAPRKGIFF